MGSEIPSSHFSAADFEAFHASLRKETGVLARWFETKRFAFSGNSFGLEVEFWLADENYLPAPQNKEYLAALSHPQIVSEISRFNAELNSSPVPAGPDSLRRMHDDLEGLWAKAMLAAEQMGLHAIAIGSLPTLRDTMLGLEYLSDMERYRALNQEVMRLRKGRPIQLDIDGRDHLQVTRADIMLESCATSLQIHFGVSPEQSVRYFNASILTSAPLVALGANAPYVFAHDLWDETRIPIFEQAVKLPSFVDPAGQPIGRVSFGSGYLRQSMLECFLENLDGYPILMPARLGDNPEKLAHLKLHNGTIWRWVRPIVGTSEAGPHLRIEQRVPSSGPTTVDTIANVAFYLGLTHALGSAQEAPEKNYPFTTARNAFYESARRGLSANIKWIDGKEWPIQALLHDRLIGQAKAGLADLGVDKGDLDFYFDQILLPRVRSGRNGAAWQRSYISTHGLDFQGLVARYCELQKEGAPVHQWSV
ncbi:MAG: hypothetical protein KDD51_13690 [Bdellovibrionales bacterium]|nr:hypothetical protein [Bdellovibrionales bacterium]